MTLPKKVFFEGYQIFKFSTRINGSVLIAFDSCILLELTMLDVAIISSKFPASSTFIKSDTTGSLVPFSCNNGLQAKRALV